MTGTNQQRPSDERWCICSDPENCTQRVPGYRCKKDFMPKATLPSKEQLLPCPFCGQTSASKVVGGVMDDYTWVECICGASGPESSSPETSAALWNKRAAPETGCAHEWIEVPGKRGLYKPSWFCPKCHTGQRERPAECALPAEKANLPQSVSMEGQPMGDPHPCDLTRAGRDPITGKAMKTRGDVSAFEQTAPPLWDCACNEPTCAYCGPRLQKNGGGNHT